MKKLTALFVLAFVLTACGGGGSSSSEESFVSGDGSTTYIKVSDRKIAPAITGMTLSGSNYTYQKDRVIYNCWVRDLKSTFKGFGICWIISGQDSNECNIGVLVCQCNQGWRLSATW